MLLSLRNGLAHPPLVALEPLHSPFADCKLNHIYLSSQQEPFLARRLDLSHQRHLRNLRLTCSTAGSFVVLEQLVYDVGLLRPTPHEQVKVMVQHRLYEVVRSQCLAEAVTDMMRPSDSGRATIQNRTACTRQNSIRIDLAPASRVANKMVSTEIYC